MIKNSIRFFSKLILLLFFITSFLEAYSQGGVFNDPNFSKAIIDFRDVSGKLMPTGSQGIEGNMMLNDQFVKGIIKLKNGKVYNGLELNFSLINNRLYVKKDSTVLQVITPVEDFVVPTNEKGKEITLHFKTGYPSIGSNTQKSFYELLSDGPKVQLLKYAYKIIQESSSYGGPIEKSFVLREHLYIYNVHASSIVEVVHNIGSLKKSLPEYSAYIDQFASGNKTKLKNEEDIIALVSSINLQP